MSEQNPLTPGEREFEEAIARLSPTRAALDPLIVAFDAGLESAAKSRRIWRAATGALLVLAIILSLTITRESVHNNLQIVDSSRPPIGSRGTELAGYVAIRNDIIERGVSALPETRVVQPITPFRVGGSQPQKL